MDHLMHPDHTIHRLIPSKFPPVNLFEWAQTYAEAEQLAQLEGLTNERLMHECGNINLIHPEDWVSGSGATPLMAAFTHPGISRFSNGHFGLYYAADCIDTAISETVYRRTQFLGASQEPACSFKMREYVTQVNKALIDIRAPVYMDLHHPDDYKASQKFGEDVYTQRAWGVYYHSVRRPGNFCVAIFRPPAVSIPVQGRHLEYVWNGSRISQVSFIQAIPEFCTI